MVMIFKYINSILLMSISFVASISLSNKKIYFPDVTGDDIADYIASKGYVPDDRELPTASLIKNRDNDANYLLSKLSDEELLKLLNDQPQRNEYNLNDIVRIAFDSKGVQDNRLQYRGENTKNINRINILGDSFIGNTKNTNNAERPYFKLNHKPIEPYKGQNDVNYIAFQKLKSLLTIPQSKVENNYDVDNDEKKELLFDILVAQLKLLCCKRSKQSNANKKKQKPFANEFLPSLFKHKINTPNRFAPVEISSNEYVFLILNDEIKSNGSDELMTVDPESLDGNSSVLLLGPVTTPLTDEQLKLVMSRISNELIKPEYVSLLQQLSDGMLVDNKNILKNFVFGPETRRYIKPHRCNHQSKLARVYGGPKWIICTGYLNLNKPSLYD
ncbi:uncharacterized protein [Epargyreus clarus]|uniref:uncharacterized protein n=1 Tax=Epargyreus clarus TaxID=520877 RepID=UPI003C2B158F